MAQIEYTKETINQLGYICLCYIFQAELDAIQIVGSTPYEQFKLKGAIEDLKYTINDAIDKFFKANGGLDKDGAQDFTFVTNLLAESMPDFADYATMMATLSYQLHVYAFRVGNKKMATRSANLYTLLSKHIDIEEFKISIKKVIENTFNVLIDATR